jgi:NAD(P)-dependent dehydrogenase (short-subunit alcohol dehydrogenase family)
MSSFAKRVALITGAGNGIGRELCRQLAAEGALIAALDRDQQGLAKLATELAGKPFASAVADVTDRPALLQAAAGFEEKLGAVDLLFASAGLGRETSAVDFSAEAIEELIRVNLIGVVNSVAAVLPGMQKRRSGHLVVISSMASYRGLPLMAGYCASKAGVNALFDSLRVELAPLGIDTTIICPAWIRTNMTANIQAKLPGLLEVDDAVRRILEAVRRRRPFFGFPRRAHFDIRLLGWLPRRLADWLIVRQFRKLKGK